MIYYIRNIQFALSDVTISGLLDTFPSLRRFKFYVIIGYCIVCFLLAIPMCAPVSREREENDEIKKFSIS
jgi:hypothetical protein